MALDPNKLALFIPPELKRFKLRLFERIGQKLGRTVRHDPRRLAELPNEIIPVIGCTSALRPLVTQWVQTKRTFIYWDRGYARRVFATDLPKGNDGGYYRWHINGFQCQTLRDVPSDRWSALNVEAWPWVEDGKHIVVAEPPPNYEKFHGIEGWTARTIAELKRHTDRPIVTRVKEQQKSGRKLHEDLAGAHCLVTHGSNAAVEAVIMGYPVFVDRCSAASLVGLTDLSQIEKPIYPDRQPWLNTLAYSQFSEAELIDGTLCRLIT